jgi:CheY-like chemotaxis protein
MWFVSEGDGACFCRVMVPLALSDASGWGVEPVPAPAVPKAILLVEDNEIARRVVRYILSRQQDKYTVDCAPDGKEALEKAARRRYDLILMDLQLPEMDGFEAACRLRSLPGYADVPVLALTANVTPEYRELCLRNGMAGFIPKPVQAAELLAAVAQALAG